MSDRKQPPKVAIVYHFFAHYRGSVVEALLASPNFDYTFYGARTDPRNIGVEAYRIRPDRFVETYCRIFKGAILYQSKLIGLALNPKYKHIIFLGDAQYPCTWIAAPLSRLMGKHVLFWTIGWMRYDTGKKRLVRNTFYKLAHRLLLYGRYAREIGIKQGFDPDKLHVVYNSLDYDAQRALRLAVNHDDLTRQREALFGDPNARYFICVSRLEKHRQIDWVMQAMKIAQDQGHAFHLLLVGKGKEEEALRALAAELGISVNFYGACYDENVLAQLFMASTASVAPGMVGLLAMHSLGYGVPVVTHGDRDNQAPEWEAMVPGVSGVTFEFGNIESLSQALVAVSDLGKDDPNFRETCAIPMERFYNAHHQVDVIERALNKQPPFDE